MHALRSVQMVQHITWGMLDHKTFPLGERAPLGPWNQASSIEGTESGITQGCWNRWKNSSHKARAAKQWRKRWAVDSSFEPQKQHQLARWKPLSKPKYLCISILVWAVSHLASFYVLLQSKVFYVFDLNQKFISSYAIKSCLISILGISKFVFLFFQGKIIIEAEGWENTGSGRTGMWNHFPTLWFCINLVKAVIPYSFTCCYRLEILGSMLKLREPLITWQIRMASKVERFYLYHCSKPHQAAPKSH